MVLFVVCGDVGLHAGGVRDRHVHAYTIHAGRERESTDLLLQQQQLLKGALRATVHVHRGRRRPRFRVEGPPWLRPRKDLVLMCFVCGGGWISDW